MNYPPPPPPELNPYQYQEPVMPPESPLYRIQPLSPKEAQSKLLPIVIILVCINILGIIVQIWSMISHAISPSEPSYYEDMLNDPAIAGNETIRGFVEFLMMYDYSGFSHFILLLQVFGAGFSIFACIRIYQLRNFNLGVIAGAIAAFPCVNVCCCLIDIPLGIWLLILLFDPKIRANFVD